MWVYYIMNKHDKWYSSYPKNIHRCWGKARVYAVVNSLLMFYINNIGLVLHSYLYEKIFITKTWSPKLEIIMLNKALHVRKKSTWRKCDFLKIKEKQFSQWNKLLIDDLYFNSGWLTLWISLYNNWNKISHLYWLNY